MTCRIRPIATKDRTWVADFIRDHWGSSFVVVHGTVYESALLSGLVAEEAGAVVGLLTYVVDGESCEVVTLDSVSPNRGVGSALIRTVVSVARDAGCPRLWLITTNDNLPALGFYQKRGFRLVAVHPGAVDEARNLKPEIPLVGLDGISIHDEIELELRLDETRPALNHHH